MIGQAEAMSVTRRVAGFMQHLRLNGFVVGPAETQMALTALASTGVFDRRAVRLGLKTLLTGRHEEWVRFDGLFEAYWSRRGRLRHVAQVSEQRSERRPDVWAVHLGDADAREAGRAADGAERAGLAASVKTSLSRSDLRYIVDPREIADAERLAFRLARAMAYRLSRRFRLEESGSRLDLRRIIHRSISHGGEPIELARKDRPDRPVRIVLLVDVSGSMKPYSRFFLQFMKGLVTTWRESDAYLFHTRLVRITDTFRERDAMAAMARLSLIAEGFGGGTRLGDSLRVFNDMYAKRALNSRSIFFIASDGYDTGTPAEVARQLARLKKRVRRLVWLNPLLGWRNYEPVTRAMTAALPFIDHFAPAHSLETLAAIEADLRSL
jgi:uncharacterized protein with von Willebrand factor type A (vWA) domain